MPLDLPGPRVGEAPWEVDPSQPVCSSKSVELKFPFTPASCRLLFTNFPWQLGSSVIWALKKLLLGTAFKRENPKPGRPEVAGGSGLCGPTSRHSQPGCREDGHQTWPRLGCHLRDLVIHYCDTCPASRPLTLTGFDRKSCQVGGGGSPGREQPAKS